MITGPGRPYLIGDPEVIEEGEGMCCLEQRTCSFLFRSVGS
jgi:hypothetical protein